MAGLFEGSMELRGQLFVLQQRLAESERARELAQMTLQVLRCGSTLCGCVRGPAVYSGPHRCVFVCVCVRLSLSLSLCQSIRVYQ
jgi:hypothetical protein